MNKASRVSLFDNWAKTYDASVQEALDFPFDGYELVLDEVARLAAVQLGMRILELGIGTGTLTKRLVNSGCAIWGVDFSTEMLALAQVNLPQIVLVQADILGDWPVELNRRYDRIVSALSLIHI